MNGKVKLQAPAREAPCAALPPKRFPSSPPQLRWQQRIGVETVKHGASTWLQRVKQSSSPIRQTGGHRHGPSGGRSQWTKDFRTFISVTLKLRNDTILESNLPKKKAF